MSDTVHTTSQIEQALISAGIGPKARKIVLARLGDRRDNSLPVIMETVEDEVETEAEMDDETKAALQRFRWIVEFEVAGTWVANGFIMSSDEAQDMIQKRLWYAREDEVSGKILMSPPLDDIAVCQGYKGASDPRFIADLNG